MVQPETEPADRSKESREGDGEEENIDYAWRANGGGGVGVSVNTMAGYRRDPFLGTA